VVGRKGGRDPECCREQGKYFAGDRGLYRTGSGKTVWNAWTKIEVCGLAELRLN
jgi:hypothetical protein